MLTVADLRQTLSTMPYSLPIYGTCCGIQRVDPGIAVVNLIAPRVPGNPPPTRYTVKGLLADLSGVNGDNLVFVAGDPAVTVTLEEDGEGLFVDVWAD